MRIILYLKFDLANVRNATYTTVSQLSLLVSVDLCIAQFQVAVVVQMVETVVLEVTSSFVHHRRSAEYPSSKVRYMHRVMLARGASPSRLLEWYNRCVAYIL